MEFKLLLTAAPGDKKYFANFLETFPILRVRVSPSSSAEKLVLLNDPKDIQDSLDSFQHFEPRGIRKVRRLPMDLRLKLVAEEKCFSFPDLYKTMAHRVNASSSRTHS